MTHKFSIGDLVTPVTPAGLQVTDNPHNGEYKSTNRKVVFVFTGIGEVIDSHDIIIDYDEWDRLKGDDYVSYNLGKVEHTDYLIKTELGMGWAGEGAIQMAENIQ